MSEVYLQSIERNINRLYFADKDMNNMHILK
jgi:hypothetical protein